MGGGGGEKRSWRLGRINRNNIIKGECDWSTCKEAVTWEKLLSAAGVLSSVPITEKKVVFINFFSFCAEKW